MLQVIHEVRSNQSLAWGEGPRAIKITKRICSQDDCTAPDRYRGTPALLGLGLSLIHKSESREVSNQWLLPLPREGGSRSTFDKLRAGETEGFSAQPEHYLAARRKSPRIPLRLGRPSTQRAFHHLPFAAYPSTYLWIVKITQ